MDPHIRDCYGSAAPALARRRRFAAGLPLLVLLTVAARQLPAQTPDAQPADPPAPSDAPKPQVVLVEGQVLDHIGSGQQGVEVTLKTHPHDGGEPTVISTTTTNDMGDFSISAAEPVTGHFVVVFAKSKFKTAEREIDLDADNLPAFVVEQLAGSLVVFGRVTDALTEEPVAGAKVKLESNWRDWEAETDADGAFTIKEVMPGPGSLIVEADRYGREQQRISKLEDFGELQIALKPERVVRLRFVDDAEQPVSGVAVESYDPTMDDFRSAFSNDEGSVEFRGVHFDTRTLSLRITHDGHVSSQGFDRTIELPADATESTHNIVMTRAGRIKGRITGAADGAPINGARAAVGEEESDFSPRDWADFEGNYEITGVPPGRAVVTIHAAGFAPELKTVQIEAGGTKELNVVLAPPATLTGVVRSEEGKPMPHVQLVAGKWRDATTLGLRAMTDDAGKFVLEGAPADEFELQAWTGGREPESFTVKAGAAPVELTVTAPAQQQQPTPAVQLKPGDEAPTFAAKDINGQSVDLAALKGKTVLLQFWATWCPPCVAEVPELVEVHKKLGARSDFAIVGISLDHDEAALKAFMSARGVAWPVVFGEQNGAFAIAEKYGVLAIPALFLIGPDGKVLRADLMAGGIAQAVEAALGEGSK